MSSLLLLADRATPVAEDSYRWQGELRLWDNEALAGTGPSTRPSGPKALSTSRFTPTEIMLGADGSA